MNDLHRAAAAAAVTAAGPWGGHSNGDIPLSALTALSWAPGHRLRSDAAAGFESLNRAYRARFGTDIAMTDSYRTLAAQQHLYETKGPGLAAKPGTSNHGWALAVDLKGGINTFGTAQHVWMVANGPAYGWIHPTWARQGGGREEAWHFEYDGSTTPTPPMEDDMTPDESRMLAEVHARLANVETQTRNIPQQVWAYINGSINGGRDIYSVVSEVARQLSPIKRGDTLTEFRKELADIRPVLNRVSTDTAETARQLLPIKRGDEVAEFRQEVANTGTLVRKVLALVTPGGAA